MSYVPQVGDKLKTMGGMDAQIMGIFPDQERCLMVAAKALWNSKYYCYMTDIHGRVHPEYDKHHTHEDLVFPVEETDIV